MPESRKKRLERLAHDIKTAHADVERHAITTVNLAIQTGKWLMEAKGLVAHGNWRKWLNQNCHVSQRQAQKYVKLAKGEAQGILDASEVKSINEGQKVVKAANAEPEPPAPEDTAPEVLEPEEEDEEYILDVEYDEEAPDAEIAPEPTAPKPESKKKDSDLLASAFKAIRRALNSVEGEKKAEWAKLIIAEIELYMMPDAVEPKRSRKKKNGAAEEPAPLAFKADYEEEVEGEEYDFSSQEEYDEFFGEGAAAAAEEAPFATARTS